MSATALRDIWEQEESWTLEEAEKDGFKPDGVATLGLVRGTFFVPDGVSRNKRVYPKALWETTLLNEDIQNRLRDRTMFGRIGHEDKSVDENDLQKGEVSHVVTKLWIDEQNRGMGEAVILGTPAGRNLYIYLKAGARLKTSSRGAGKYESAPTGGLPVVDEKSFLLETFDFVIRAGFPQVNPRLSENMNAEVDSVVKTLQESRDKIQETLTTSFKDLNEARAALSAERKALQEAQANLDEVTKKAAILEDLMTKNQIKETAHLFEALTELAEWKKVGDREAVKTSLARIPVFEAIGTPEEIETGIASATRVLKAYSALGSVSKIRQIVEAHGKIVKNARDRALTEAAKNLSRDYGVEVEKAKSMLIKMPLKEAQELLVSLGVQKAKHEGAPARKEVTLSSGANRLFEGMIRTRPGTAAKTING